MKKTIFITIALMIISCFTAQAKNGDVIGTVYNTDIVTYINHYAIPSYAVNGTSCIVAEDLRNFGFDVTWNNQTRSLSIIRNANTLINEMTFEKTGAASSKFTNLLETDISVYANGKKITSYAINGYTVIPAEELTMFGECYWVSEERALKLWVDGIKIRNEKQYVKQVLPTPTTTKSSNTSAANSSNPNSGGSAIYRTPSGKRYHYDPDCGGKNSYQTTLQKALNAGLTPCKKCAQ